MPSPSSSYYVIDELARSLFLTPLVQKFFDSSLPVPESSELVPSNSLSKEEKKWIRRTVREFDRKEKKRTYLAASLIKSPVQAESAPLLAISSDEAGPSLVDKGKRKADDSPSSSPKRVKYTAFSERELASLAAFVDAPDVDPAQFHEANHTVEEPQRIGAIADMDVDFTWTSSGRDSWRL